MTATLLDSPADIGAFQTGLLDWYGRHKRDLAWRETGDPYLVWVSEVMLQQTRADQMAGHFQRFVAAFPTVAALAAASEGRVLKV